MHEYDLIADWYATERDHATGLPETVSLAQSLAPASRVLDIGCGNGVPITRALLAAGHRVLGVDSSSAMLERFRVNCPEADAVQGSIESLPLPACDFDAAVSWGVLFHLPPDKQISAIANVSRALKSGAPFLFTAGDVDGLEPKPGTMNGVTFHYYSYSRGNYERILGEHGLTLQQVHTDAGQNTYYLALKR